MPTTTSSTPQISPTAGLDNIPASALSTSDIAPLPTPPGQARRINIRRSDPIPLTASQEAEVKDLYYKRVRTKCADEIRAFATCSTGRTFSISWACRTQRLAMNTCMNSFAGREEEDRAREEWFQKLPERQAEKEELERWKDEQRKKKREWWDLDEQGRRIIRPEGEKGTS